MRFISPQSTRNAAVFSVKDVMGQMLETYQLSRRFKESRLLASWTELMGKPIAEYTEKLFIKDRILYVEIASASLKEELCMTKSLVLQLLNKPFNEQIIDRIIFL